MTKKQVVPEFGFCNVKNKDLTITIQYPVTTSKASKNYYLGTDIYNLKHSGNVVAN